MTAYAKAMNVLSKGVLYFTGILLVLMVITISWQVYTRFLMDASSPWSEQLTLVFMIYFGFFGATIAYREGLHIGIRFLINKFSDKARRTVFFILDLFLIVFAFWLIIYGTQLTVAMMDQTLPALEIPVAYSYLPIPLSGVVFLLFVIENLIDNIKPPLEEEKAGED